MIKQNGARGRAVDEKCITRNALAPVTAVTAVTAWLGWKYLQLGVSFPGRAPKEFLSAKMCMPGWRGDTSRESQ